MSKVQSLVPLRTRITLLLGAAILASAVSMACGGGRIGADPRTSKNSPQAGNSGNSSQADPPQNKTTIADIQAMPGWQRCIACAGGRGHAQSSLVPHQITPSLGRDSSQFDISGSDSYSNALWWRTLDVPQSATHFTYDVYFYLEDPAAPEALEFDANQSYGGVRYTWGTQCSYRDTHKWDVWDPENQKWVSTSVPCKQVSAHAWHHLVWQFEKTQGGVRYVGLELDGNFSSVDMRFGVQQNWNAKETNVAFQMDGDIHQKPYKVWLDHLNLTHW